jgi:hypothetical protein
MRAFAEHVTRRAPKEQETLRQGARLHDQGQYEEDREAILRRSLEAESALQAEVALLRERALQLQAELEDQRRTFVGGVQQMMQPVQEYFVSQHVDVPFASLMAEVLTRLESLANVQAEVERLRAETKTLRRPVEVRRVAPDVAEIGRLSDRLDVVERLIAAHLPLSRDASLGPEPSGGLGTFVMSDRQAADIERAILEAQTRGSVYGQ